MITTRFRDWLRLRFTGARRGRGEAGRRRAYRPRLEPLEDRCAPAVLTWTCGFANFGNHWSVGSNWDLGRVPEDRDALLFLDNGGLSPESVNDIQNIIINQIFIRGRGAFG